MFDKTFELWIGCIGIFACLGLSTIGLIFICCFLIIAIIIECIAITLSTYVTYGCYVGSVNMNLSSYLLIGGIINFIVFCIFIIVQIYSIVTCLKTNTFNQTSDKFTKWIALLHPLFDFVWAVIGIYMVTRFDDLCNQQNIIIVNFTYFYTIIKLIFSLRFIFLYYYIKG